MQDTFQHYKQRLVVALVILSYAYLHFKLCGLYDKATLSQFAEFTAEMPMRQRLLIPALVALLSKTQLLNHAEWFFLFEIISVSLSFWAINKLLQHHLKPQLALSLTVLFFLFLPLTTVINYRWTLGQGATMFFPYDSLSLFFIACGFLLILEKRWKVLYCLIFIATFNRETTFLLTFLIPCLHRQWRLFLTPCLITALIYLLARVLINGFIIHDVSNTMTFNFNHSTYSHWLINWLWIKEQFNGLLVLSSYAFLPLFWFFLHDYIPAQFQRIRYLVLSYFMLLMIVGNVFESRIYSESVLLLYLPVMLGLRNWLNNNKLAGLNWQWHTLLARYGVIVLFSITALFALTGSQKPFPPIN